MSQQNAESSIRLSQNRARSNPILASEREYRLGLSLREKEQRQFDRLEQLQRDGVPLFRVPEMHRVDASSLPLCSERVGVVGLVVDNYGEGFVTRLHVQQSSTWEIAASLPFRQTHIQDLLLGVLSGSGLDDSLPELFAYRITDSLTERCEGDSMDIAGLLAVLDANNEEKNGLLSAAAAVVSPIANDLLEPSKSVSAKLKAFVREFGNGSLLVRHSRDEHAAEFDDYFDEVWTVSALADLSERLTRAGLLETLLENFKLSSAHGVVIATQLALWLKDEAKLERVQGFIDRVKRRINDETPIKIRLEVSLAEEDLYRHRGDFDSAITVREQRIALTSQKFVSCYERELDADNRHAAALYDAHRFSTAINCLESWIQRVEQDPKICMPETRARSINTLARCLVVTGDPRWEDLFELSLRIQSVCDPYNIPVTENYFAHGYLKLGRIESAKDLLNKRQEKPDAFRIWLSAEYARQAGVLWDDEQCGAVSAIDPKFHVHGFACQAIARQRGRGRESRLKYLELARQSFSHGMDRDKTNIKRVLGIFCSMGIAVVTEDFSLLGEELQRFRSVTLSSALKNISEWYEHELEVLEHNQDWCSADRLLQRVPHL